MDTGDALRELDARLAAGQLTLAEYWTQRGALLAEPAVEPETAPEPAQAEPAPPTEPAGPPPDPSAAAWYPPPAWASPTGQLPAEPPVTDGPAPTADPSMAVAPMPTTSASAAAPVDETDHEPPRAEPPRPPGPPGTAYPRQPPTWNGSGDDWLPLADTWAPDDQPAGRSETAPVVPTPAPPSSPPPPPLPVRPAPAATDAERAVPVPAPNPDPDAAPVSATTPRASSGPEPAAPAHPSGALPPPTLVTDERSSGGGGVRRAWIGVLALAVLVAAGVLVWRLTSDNGTPTAAPSSSSAAPTTPASSVASSPPTSAKPSSSGPPRADAQHPFGVLADTTLSPQGSGPATLAQATARNVIYPEEVTALAGCGATTGSTEVIVGPGWSLSGTVFGCRDVAGARAVVSRVGTFERALGFTPTTLDNPRVMGFYSTKNPPTPGYPAQFHVRYTSGTKVIGLVIQAKSERIGRQAANQVVAGAATFYPPSG